MKKSKIPNASKLSHTGPAAQQSTSPLPGVGSSALLGVCPKCKQASILCDNEPQSLYRHMTNVWCALCDYNGAIKRLVLGEFSPTGAGLPLHDTSVQLA